MLQHRSIAIRRAHEALRSGEMTNLLAQEDILNFQRTAGDQTIFCGFNLSDTPSRTDLPEGDWTLIGAELGSANLTPDGHLHLGPWQVCLALKRH